MRPPGSLFNQAYAVRRHAACKKWWKEGVPLGIYPIAYKESRMNSIIYMVGLVVIVIAIVSFVF